jgi:hypothetical protein
MANPNATGALGLILLLYIVEVLVGSTDYGLGWMIIVVLTAIAVVPILVALILSAWAATRPSAEGA